MANSIVFQESQVDDDALLPPKYRLVCSEEDKIHPASHSKEEEYCQVRVLSNERVTHSEHFQVLSLIEFPITDISIDSV